MIDEMQIKTGTKKRNSRMTVSLESGSCLSSHAVAGTVLWVYEGLTLSLIHISVCNLAVLKNEHHGDGLTGLTNVGKAGGFGFADVCGAVAFCARFNGALIVKIEAWREHTPCVQSVSVTIPALRRLDRNGCGCATAQARQISIRWPTSPPWRLRWPPFCMVLTPTVLPNSFGVPPDLSFRYLLQARGLPRYGFCALEMP